jgi:hypothetical protein
VALPVQQLPRLQQLSSSEDQKVVNVLTELQTIISSIESVNITNNTIPPAKIETQPTWSTLTLVNGGVWSPTTMAYWKDSLGIVHIRPEFYTPTIDITDNTIIATLPAGNRPGVSIIFGLCLNLNPNNNQISRVLQIDIDGNIRFRGGTWVVASSPRGWVGGPEFKAEN